MKPLVRFSLFTIALLLTSLARAEEPFVWAPDFNVGDAFPEVSLKDQHGELRALNQLSGEQGYLIVLNRSVVW